MDVNNSRAVFFFNILLTISSRQQQHSDLEIWQREGEGETWLDYSVTNCLSLRCASIFIRFAVLRPFLRPRNRTDSFCLRCLDTSPTSRSKNIVTSFADRVVVVVVKIVKRKKEGRADFFSQCQRMFSSLLAVAFVLFPCGRKGCGERRETHKK